MVGITNFLTSPPVMGLVDYVDRDIPDFIAVHEFDHQKIAEQLGDRSSATTRFPLFGDLNKDWFAAHDTMHRSIADALGMPTSFVLESTAENRPWESKEGFDAWQQDHQDEHSLILEFLNP
jgi:hypothetical protein